MSRQEETDADPVNGGRGEKGADINRGVIFARPAFFGPAVLAAELNSICPGPRSREKKEGEKTQRSTLRESSWAVRPCGRAS